MKPKRRIRAWAVVVWLLIWQAVGTMIGKDILLVTPAVAFLRLIQLSVTAEFWASIFFSLTRIGLGFSAGVVVGVLFAYFSFYHQRVREFLEPMMQTIRSVPVASFIILALIWFSSKNLSVLISFLMVLPIMYQNTLAGMESADPLLKEMASVFEVPASRYLRYIYVAQLMPFVRAGVSVSLGLSWKAGVAAEVIGVPSRSIGEHLQHAKIYLDTPSLFAWTIVIVGLSVLFEKSVLALMDFLAEKARVMR